MDNTDVTPMMMMMMPSMAQSAIPPDVPIWMHRNRLYPKELWWTIASFIGLVTIFQFFSWVGSKASSPYSARMLDTEATGGMVRERRLRLSRFPLAVINWWRAFAFRNTVEFGDLVCITYAEAIISLSYVVALFTWGFINTTNLAGQPLDFMYYSSRAGAVAVSQFPLITVLGTKNNVLSYVTGVSSDKLNFLHRLTARVNLILLWVHAGNKFQILVPDSYKDIGVRVGLTAISSYSLLFLLAFRPLRARLYEFFFLSHFALVLIFLIGAFFHSREAAHLEAYVYPCFIIWGVDRIARLFRLVYFNNHLFSMTRRAGPSGMDDGLSASAELLSPKCIRLHVTRPAQFKWTPGQAAYLIIPGLSRHPLEAHPFTIASVDTRYRLVRSKMAQKMEMMDDGSMMNGREDEYEVLPYWEDLEFLIDVRGGVTKRLAERAMRGGKVKVWVDGPYGFSPNLRNDDVVVLVAGGSGVSLTISLFLAVLSDVQNMKARTRKVVFIWSVRDSKQFGWISKSLMKALESAPSGLDIVIRIFMTGHQNADQMPLMMNRDDMPSMMNRNSMMMNRDSMAMNRNSMMGRSDMMNRGDKDKTNRGDMPSMMNQDSMNRGEMDSRMSQDGMPAMMGTGDMQRTDNESTYSMGATPTAMTMNMNMRRELKDFSYVHLSSGRPELGGLLRQEVQRASGGRLSVTVCGGHAVAKACREALKFPFSSFLYGGPSIVLHVETFGYA